MQPFNTTPIQPLTVELSLEAEMDCCRLSLAKDYVEKTVRHQVQQNPLVRPAKKVVIKYVAYLYLLILKYHKS